MPPLHHDPGVRSRPRRGFRLEFTIAHLSIKIGMAGVRTGGLLRPRQADCRLSHIPNDSEIRAVGFEPTISGPPSRRIPKLSYALACSSP